METSQWNDLQQLALMVIEAADEAGTASGKDDAWRAFWDRLQPTLERWAISPQFLGRVSRREDYRRDIVMLAWEKLQDNNYSKLRTYFDYRPKLAGSKRSTGCTFGAWMFRVFKNIGIDYMRALPEYIRNPRSPYRAAMGGSRSSAQTPERESDVYWHALVSLKTDIDPAGKTPSSHATVHQLLEFLDDSVPPRQRHAARLREQGRTYDSIAVEIGLPDGEDAHRIVQRGLARLKYRPALEMWSQRYSNREIAQELELDSPEQASRIVNAAKELLRRHFRT